MKIKPLRNFYQDGKLFEKDKEINIKDISVRRDYYEIIDGGYNPISSGKRIFKRRPKSQAVRK
jgi:hypothetical protein